MASGRSEISVPVVCSQCRELIRLAHITPILSAPRFIFGICEECALPQSAIRNPQSAIRNPQSAIRNPQSPDQLDQKRIDTPARNR
jgi:major type 1 subunit fimbrin (pilin)